MNINIEVHDPSRDFSLFFDPREGGRVYAQPSNLYPMDAHNGIDIALGIQVPPYTNLFNLASWIEGQEDELELLAKAFEGTYCDGSNYKGRWDDCARSAVLGRLELAWHNELCHYPEMYYSDEEEEESSS